MEISPEVIVAVEIAKWPILALPGVVGIGIGLREENGVLYDELAIRVYVNDITIVPYGIPQEIGGVGVCIVQSLIELCGIPDLSRYSIIMGGIKIIKPGKAAGTLGAVVQDSITGELMGLSCYHVIGDKNAVFPDIIWQPDHPPFVAGDSVSPVDNIGHVHRVDFPQTPPLPFSPVVAGLTDAGIFTLTEALEQGRNLSPSILDHYDPATLFDRITATAVPFLSESVRKRGFKTGITFGKIIDAFGTFKWAAGPTNSYLVEQSVIEGSSSNPNGIFCSDGDSGSVVLDENSSTAVGLLWGMSNGGRRGYMCHIRNVEAQLGINMDWS